MPSSRLTRDGDGDGDEHKDEDEDGDGDGDEEQSRRLAPAVPCTRTTAQPRFMDAYAGA
ncbi:hypothetical protein AB0K49_03325 [Streptomyces decoyicus]|uniref:hypothetical protein n=1 Tax=Streptomyces decoyicus TaxID=249567 RepID=UPI00345D4428